jgi:hypothetical protein
VRNTEGHEGADSTKDNGDDVEGSETLLDLMALIPAGDDKDKRRKEASLKEKPDQFWGLWDICRKMMHLKDTEPDAAENEPSPG